MHNAVMDQVALALEELDFEQANARVAAIEAEIAQADAAIETARNRCNEIAAAIRNAKGIDGAAVAAALMEEGDTALAARSGPDEELLRKESEALQSGIRELVRRQDDLRAELHSVRLEAAGEVSRALTPLVDEIMADCQAHARGIVEGFAQINAINFACRGHALSLHALTRAVQAINGPDSVLPGQRIHAVPHAMVELLAELRNKGRCLQPALIEVAHLP